MNKIAENEGFEQMDYAIDQGVNFWDTAEIYSVPPRQETFGHTETIIGNWFEKIKKKGQSNFSFKSLLAQ